jgi:lipoprotein-releasing system ATP-binding protein
MLEIRDIHKVYRTGKKTVAVLKGVGLDVAEASFIAIVGPSGAGKSTLLNILGGLDEPTRGSVFFEGRDLYRMRDEELSVFRNEKVGFVFQFYHLLSEFTVLENVMMPALIGPGRGQGPRRIRDNALRLLERAGLAQRIGHFPGELSGGERQRVAIARALINTPRLLLCDEPTGNLDSKIGSEIMSLVTEISLDSHMAVVMVTHNQQLAQAARHVYHLRDGVLSGQDSPEPAAPYQAARHT